MCRTVRERGWRRYTPLYWRIGALAACFGLLFLSGCGCVTANTNRQCAFYDLYAEAARAD